MNMLKKQRGRVDMFDMAVIGVLLALMLSAILYNGSKTVCHEGVKFNRDGNGTEVQIIGKDGLPLMCEVKEDE